jgi:GNAT superfamily N-acetyltransferase
MNIKLIKADSGDTPAIIALVRELAESSGEISPVNARCVQNYLAYPGCEVILAKIDQKPVGLISFSIKPNLFHGSDVCVIEELVSSAAHRGKGVGAALLERVKVIAKERNCAELGLGAYADNKNALRFYRHHGLTDEAVWLEMHFPPEEQ